MSILLDDFQGHVTVQHLVVSAIDNPHSSFPNLRHDAAVTENLTNHKALLAANVRLRFRYQSMNARIMRAPRATTYPQADSQAAPQLCTAHPSCELRIVDGWSANRTLSS